MEIVNVRQYMHIMTEWAEQEGIKSFYHADMPEQLRNTSKKFHQRARTGGYITKVSKSKHRTVALWRISKPVKNTYKEY